MVLTVIGFDYSYSVEILLNDIVKFVIRLEDSVEYWVYGSYQDIQAYSQYRQYSEEHQRQLRVYSKRGYQRKDQHSRRSGCYSYAHLKGHLNVGDVSGKPRHYAGRRKFIYVGEGKFLYMIVHGASEVLSKSC